MKLLMISHKETWSDPAMPDVFVTIGGFPFHVHSITRLFDSSRLVVTQRASIPPSGTQPIKAPNLTVLPLPEPTGRDLRRKLTLLLWLPRYLPIMWREIARADAVHTPVPGDIGFIGLLIALLQRKPLFVRHCGTWGEPVTISDRFLLWLLELIADGRNVVLATGGAETLPSARNPNIQWIFSTTLSRRELDEMPLARNWDGRVPLRLITVGRLTCGKNTMAVIEAFPAILAVHPSASLDILGDGEYRAALQARAADLGLAQAVHFHGNVSHEQVLTHLSRAHLFVFPTRVKEGFPKAVLEALACGLPVIATRVSVISQLLQDGAGMLLDDTSAPVVARAILKMAAEPKTMERMGQLAREVAQRYTLEAWSAAIGEHLRAAWGPLKKI